MSLTKVSSSMVEGLIQNVLDFGADPSGTSDSTAALQNAIDNCSSLYLPDGTYNISSGLVVNNQVNIFGSKNAIIYNSNANLAEPIILIKASAANRSTISGFQITSTQLSGSNGAHGIEIEGGNGFILENLRIRLTDKGIYVSKVQAGSYILNCIFEGTESDGLHVDAGNMCIDKCYSLFSKGHGFNFTSATAGSGGITLTSCTSFQSVGNGFNFVGNSTYGIGDTFVENCINSTSPTGHGFYFDNHGKNIIISNCFSELAGVGYDLVPVSSKNGFYIKNTCHRVSMSNCQATFSSASGLILDCSYFSVSGGDFTANNALFAAGNSGIIVGNAGNTTSFTITGVNTKPKSVSDIDAQKYGIDVQNTATFGTITGCVLHGTTKPINIDSSSSVQISSCAGYVNQSYGISYIPTGQNSVTVTHNLYAAPTSIIVTPTNANLSGKDFWASLGTGSTFGINVSSNVASDTYFSWVARI